jgi:DNA-binding PadR family transcriptional regulator
MKKNTDQGLGRGKGQRGLGVMGLLRPSILIQLSKADQHGYALLEGVEDFNFDVDHVDPSLIYRTLRKMEEDQLLESYEGEDSLGPKRKIYHILPKGEKYLAEMVQGLEQRKLEIENLLSAYQTIEKRNK